MRILIVLLLILSNGCVTVQSKISAQEEYIAQCFAKARAIEYKHDDPEYWQLPEETIELKTGDCEDKAFYLLSMLSEKGIKSRIVVGHTLGIHRGVNASDSLHAWNEVEINGETYVLDATSDLYRNKNRLGGYYEWDITQDKDSINVYAKNIRYYIGRAHKNKKFAKSVRESFFRDE
jgi:transglutaminase-like putative cysteine protease